MMKMPFTDFDPYEHLMEMTRFCNAADKHIQNLLKNQAVMTKTINGLKEEIGMLKAQIDLLEQIIEGND